MPVGVGRRRHAYGHAYGLAGLISCVRPWYRCAPFYRARSCYISLMLTLRGVLIPVRHFVTTPVFQDPVGGSTWVGAGLAAAGEACVTSESAEVVFAEVTVEEALPVVAGSLGLPLPIPPLPLIEPPLPPRGPVGTAPPRPPVGAPPPLTFRA